MTDAVIEVKEQINEVKAFLYCKDNLPDWVKEAGQNKLRTLTTRVKILEAYKR